MGFGIEDMLSENPSHEGAPGGFFRIGVPNEGGSPRLWLTSASGKAARNLKRTILSHVPVGEKIRCGTEFIPEAKFGFLKVKEDGVERLIDKFGTMEEALAHLSGLKGRMSEGPDIARLNKREIDIPVRKNSNEYRGSNVSIFNIDSLIEVLNNHYSALENVINLLRRYHLEYSIGKTIIETDRKLIKTLVILVPSSLPLAATITVGTESQGGSFYEVELIEGGSYSFTSLEDVEDLLREINIEQQMPSCDENRSFLTGDLPKRVLEIMENEIHLIGLFRRVLQKYLRCFTPHCEGLGSAYALIREGLIDTEMSLHRIVGEFAGGRHGIETEGDEESSRNGWEAGDERGEESDQKFIETGLVVLEAAWRLSLDGFNISSTGQIIGEIRRKNGEDYPIDPGTVNRVLRNIGAKGKNSVWNIGFLSAYRFAELKEAWLSKFRDN